MGRHARTKRWVRAAIRRPVAAARWCLLRALRPFIAQVDRHTQWLFDRQQVDRMRLVRLEQQVIELQRQLAAHHSRAA